MRKLLKIIKEDLNKFKNLNLNIANDKKNPCIFFDVGYGDKFFIYYLSIKDLNKLSDFSTYNVFKDILNRYINVGYPKGFRTRFFINFNENTELLKNNLLEIGSHNVLLIFILNNGGIGNEKLAVNNLNNNLVKRLEKLIEHNGLDTSLIIDKDFNFDFEGINTLWLKPYPNKFYHELDRRFFCEEFKDKAVFTINLISKKIFE